jgi:succinate dehydrogenase/fumarate reductase cytochrome b subunit
LDSSQEVKLHPSSVMFGFKPELVIFYQLMATQKSYIKDLSLVDPVILFCYHLVNVIKLANWQIGKVTNHKSLSKTKEDVFKLTIVISGHI